MLPGYSFGRTSPRDKTCRDEDGGDDDDNEGDVGDGDWRACCWCLCFNSSFTFLLVVVVVMVFVFVILEARSWVLLECMQAPMVGPSTWIPTFAIPLCTQHTCVGSDIHQENSFQGGVHICTAEKAPDLAQKMLGQ